MGNSGAATSRAWLANQSAGWGGGRLGKAYGGGRSRRLVHSNRAGGEASRRSPTCRMKPRHLPRGAASGWSPAPRAAWDGCAVWWNGELAWHACARPAGGDWTTVESEGCGPGACAGDAGPNGGARLLSTFWTLPYLLLHLHCCSLVVLPGMLFLNSSS